MGNRIPVSVCMATFNGERYVPRQIETILSELSSSDELIVVDDCSTDRTVDIVRSIQDPRISVHRNVSNQRQVRSFATAIALARNDILFLADQDDIWIPGRVDLMCEALEAAGAALVASNFEWIDEAEIRSIFRERLSNIKTRGASSKTFSTSSWGAPNIWVARWPFVESSFRWSCRSRPTQKPTIFGSLWRQT